MTIMYLLYGFIILAYHANGALPIRVSYDQRQTGDLNVQVDLKNVHVLALINSETLDDYTEYDYFYDYADFTVKPPSKPTMKPIATSPAESSTIIVSTTNSPTLDVDEQNLSNKTEEVTFPNISNSTTSDDSLTESSSSSSSSSTSSSITPSADVDGSSEKLETLKTRINDKAEDIDADENESVTKKFENETTESANIPRPEKELKKRCKAGYSPNGKGRCRSISRQRLSLVPIAMKLAPRIFGAKTQILPEFQLNN